MSKIKSREEKWQNRWRAARAFVPVNDGAKPRHYILVEFPFLSGTGLHAGHLMNYSGCDALARFYRARGRDVLFPMGYDAFGITAEHFATKIGKHPADVVRDLIERYSAEIDMLGWSVDPDSRISTTDPEYIKWTQWQFIQFFKNGIAYKSDAPMNWCPACKTCLTNEELEEGNCERCKGPVERKMKSQWMLGMSKYADRLVDDLALVDYPERVKAQQINWIGRSYGADVDFKVADDILTVYTTRIDTIFGATFCVLAPEHAMVEKWLAGDKIKNSGEVCAYIAAAKQKSEMDRADNTREKTGVKLQGVCATNPFNGAEIPLFISDYVLADYGYGAVMAVPAHDGRDWEFAKKFGLPIIPVLAGGDILESAWEFDGAHINSDFMDGMNKDDAIAAAIERGEKGGFARAAKQFKLRDWAFSRQMYWGEPIPLIHCPICGWVPVPDESLPVLQPHMTDYRPTSDGESPLARATDWVNVPCPNCGCAAKRETDTMPGWAGSSWFWIRYLDPKNTHEFCSAAQIDNWLPVNHYNGGHEHNTRHLLYARFWYKALFDLGLVNTTEPFSRRTSQGLLMGSDGKKMSKSRNNGFLVMDMIDQYGADIARASVLSLGPWENNVSWTDGALAGVQRFLKRVEALSDTLADCALNAEQEFLVNDLIAKATYRIENMQFNTAISAMMEYINEMVKTTNLSAAIGDSFPESKDDNEYGRFPRRAYEILLQVLNPFAPHLTEEMWEKLGHKEMLVFEPWPVADETKLVKSTVTMAVSVNGKHRGEIHVPTNADEKMITEFALPVAKKYITGDIDAAKKIIVPGRMINFVIKG
ncbi:MAG: leucine--tRNA ligase [Alphaproteobacteria bacterium]|nr:leucine--tRNA ligase [Alphaproteobacteria bacterium]